MNKLSYVLLVVFYALQLSACKKDRPEIKPQLSTLSESSGAPGENIVMNGVHLGTTSSVKFGSKSTSPLIVNPGSVIVKVPADMPPGVVQLSVVTSIGETNGLPFTVAAPKPAILFIQPASGLPGDTVTLKGHNLSTLTKVYFSHQASGRVEASVIATKVNELTIKIPEGAKTGALIIINQEAEVISNEIFTVIGVPSNLLIHPAKGAAGSMIAITGSNVEGATVSFDQFQSTIEATSADKKELKVRVPDLPFGVVNVVVSFPGGIAENIPFEVIPTSPTISGVLPFVVYAEDAILITGFNFGSTATVKFNETAAQVTSNTGNEIITKVPSGLTPGEINIFVTAETGVSSGFSITLQAGRPQMPSSPATVVIPPTPGAGNLPNVTNAWRNKYDPDHILTLTDPDVEVGTINGTENHTTLPEYDQNPMQGKIDRINKVIEFTITRKSDTAEEYSETYRGVVTNGTIVVRSTITGRQWVFGG